MITYKEYTNEMGEVFISRDNGDGTISFFPTDKANSDYQAYLKRDEPQVEHLTEIPTN